MVVFVAWHLVVICKMSHCIRKKVKDKKTCEKIYKHL